MWIELLIWIVVCVVAQANDAFVLYHIPGLGNVRGTIVEVPSIVVDTNVHQFTGIPFAQPPVGDLRFAAPQAVKPWEPMIINATKSSPSCMQDAGSLGGSADLYEDSVIQEDCLYLNIWVPQRDTQDMSPLPVMVWIYGGGFTSGSVSTKIYTGDALAAVGNVIVVTLNYRLGSFGFAHLGSPGKEEALIPGNIGLMDQQMGLRWVKTYIRHFGGDPDLVTVFGQSAGSGSVTAQLAAPGSTDLFRRAIAQSGSMTDPWATETAAYIANNTLQLADKLGCKDTLKDIAATLRCLRGSTAEAVLNATGSLSMKPIVNDPFFFKGSVFDRLSSTDLSKKSVMMGNTVDEFRFFLPYMNDPRFSGDIKWSLDRRDYAEVGRTFFTIFGEGITLQPLLQDALLWHYDNATAFGDSYLDRFTHLSTDFFFTCGERRTARDWIRLDPARRPKQLYLYLYNQTYATSDGLGLAQMKAFHTSDVSAVFGEVLRRVPFPEDDKTRRITNGEQLKDNAIKVIRFWTNFAKYGNPNGNESESLSNGDIWTPSTDPDKLMFRVLQSDEEYSHMIPNPSTADCAFWEDVIEVNTRLQAED